MEQFYDWKPEYTRPVITIFSVSIGFICYWFLSVSEKVKGLFFNRFTEKKAWVNYFLYQKLTGVVFMGMLPGIVVLSTCDSKLSEFGISIGNLKESLLYTGVMSLLILFINYFVSKGENNLKMYPQMRIESWTKSTIILNTIGWACYLFAYEFMYRGLLLMVCHSSFGFWPAVAINLSFYSATHIAKGLTETIGTFPYGILLCFITVSTGSIFVAFATHLILALSNDFYSIHHNPKMKFV